MYNPAFDPFNGIYRMLNILKHFDTHEIVEVDRLRIYDFYLLFPYKAYMIRFKKTEADWKKQLSKFVKEKRLILIIRPSMTAVYSRSSCAIR